VEILQPRNLILTRRHHQFAANLVFHSVRLAKFDHLSDAGNCEFGFQRSWFVVKTAMQHAAVMPSLVLTHSGFLLIHRHLRTRVFFLDAARRSQPYHAAAYNRNALESYVSHASILGHLGLVRRRAFACWVFAAPP